MEEANYSEVTLPTSVEDTGHHSYSYSTVSKQKHSKEKQSDTQDKQISSTSEEGESPEISKEIPGRAVMCCSCHLVRHFLGIAC